MKKSSQRRSGDKTNEKGGKYVSYLKKILQNNFDLADSQDYRYYDRTGIEEDDDE